MVSRKLSFLVFASVIAVLVILSVVFWTVATSTSNETWKSIGYPSAFLLGIIGAASVVVPVPTTVVLLAIAGSRIFDPTLLAIAFGLGAAVGQLTSYMVGYVGSMVVGKKQKHSLGAMLKIFERYGMAAVFIFALTPLPDSLLFVPLGLVHYSLWKIFAATVAGKIVMSLIITHFGGLIGQVAESWVFGVITTVLLVLVVIAMFKVDWEKLVDRYLPKKKK
jgi:membrane protein DedA with SNARE-associated domain